MICLYHDDKSREDQSAEFGTISEIILKERSDRQRFSAILAWRYKPTLVDGKPMSVCLTVDEVSEVRARTSERRKRVNENDDLCLMAPGGGDEMPRFFLRTVLPVPLTDVADYTQWGFWVEVAETDARRAWDLWDDPRQGEEPAFEGRIANRVMGYPDTIGLAVRVQATGRRRGRSLHSRLVRFTPL